MADGVKPTIHDIEIARKGIMVQLNCNCPDIIGLPGVKDFIENQVQVIACERAYSRMLLNSLNPE